MISSFFFSFFFHKKSTRKLYIRHPSLSICGTHQPVTVGPPPFPQSLQTSLSKNGFILSTSRFTTSRACGFGKISRDCLDLLDIPFHTFSLCFPHVSGSEIFFFFLFDFFSCPSIASSPKSVDYSEKEAKRLGTTGPSIASIRRRG